MVSLLLVLQLTMHVVAVSSFLQRGETIFHPFSGLSPLPTAPSRLSIPIKSTPSTDIDFSRVHAVDQIELLTNTACEHMATEKGLDALRQLGKLCSQREPFDFQADKVYNTNTSILVKETGLVSPDTIDSFMEQVQEMETNGWLGTNPDSVDGLPSLHLNLVSNGQAMFKESDDCTEFQLGIQKLLALVKSSIYDTLLPKVQSVLQLDDVVVSDVFLRRYGDDIAGRHARRGISAHYDVFSIATAVIAMDDTASEGTNGLYTIASTRASRTSSNHAALRRFFPLKRGDGILHSWDMLHGVDVESGKDRTSLIVWFSTSDAISGSATSSGMQLENQLLSPPPTPWLFTMESNDILQFVLASATESSIGESETRSNKESLKTLLSNLYLQSGAAGNTFALTRVGSMCEEGELSDDLLDQAKLLADQNFKEVPKSMSALFGDNRSKQAVTAMRFWLEASRCGNPLAQIALGDEAMSLAVDGDCENLRAIAALFFALAAQQGNDSAISSLSRVVDYTASRSRTEQDFASSQVVSLADAAMSFFETRSKDASAAP